MMSEFVELVRFAEVKNDISFMIKGNGVKKKAG